MNDRLKTRLQAIFCNEFHPLYGLGNEMLESILAVIEECVTDMRDPDTYKRTCAYCGRPADETYG